MERPGISFSPRGAGCHSVLAQILDAVTGSVGETGAIAWDRKGEFTEKQKAEFQCFQSQWSSHQIATFSKDKSLKSVGSSSSCFVVQNYVSVE